MSAVTLECRTRELRAGKRQTLVLLLASKGNSSLSLLVPLGGGADSLMTEEEFEQTQCQLDPYLEQDDPVSNNGVGCIRVRFDDLEFQYEVELTLPDFMVSAAGSVEIRVVDEKSQEVATKAIGKLATAPTIKSFEANPYNLASGGSTKLSWAIEPAPDDHQDLYLGDSKLERSTREITRKVDGKTDFALTLRDPEGATLAQAQLRVHAFGHSLFDSLELSMTTPEGTAPAGILGCFASEEFLWVLLRENDNQATLWKTKNGFDPADRQWLQERRGDQTATSEPVRIPLQAARRPGVIFKGKLWLLGGDCCHPDKPSNAVGRYDLQGNGQFRDGTAPWPARMGHMVVRVDAERLWVMGGWRPGGGPLNDIWQFDGTTWTQLLPAPMWKPRCLFGATVTDKDVWIAGGFESPGGQTYDDIWRYTKSDKEPKWESIKTEKAAGGHQPSGNAKELIDISLSPEDDWQYCASLMFSLDKELLIFTSYYDPSDKRPGYRRHIRKIDRERGWHLSPYIADDVSALGLIDDLDYFSLDGVVFNNAMFLRELKPNHRYASRKLPYFVKV